MIRTGFLVSALLTLLPTALFSHDNENVNLKYQLKPTISGMNSEKGMIQITLSNNSAENLPADTIQITTSGEIKLETSVIPFDSIAAGASISMLLPYQKKASGNTNRSDVLSASLNNKQELLLIAVN